MASTKRAATNYENPIEAYGVGLLDSVFKAISDGSIRPPGMDRPTQFDWTGFEPYSQWFTARQNYRVANPSQLVDVYSKQTGIKFNATEKEVLKRAFALVPENLRAVGADPKNPTALIGYINLIPYLDSIEASFTQAMSQANDGEQVSKEWLDVVGAVTKTKTSIRNYYVQVEKERIQTMQDPAAAAQWQAMTEEERNAEIDRIIDAGGAESPLIRLLPPDQMKPVADSATPTMDKYSGAFVAEDESMSPLTYDEYLRLNPESSIYQIAQLETEGTMFGEGFTPSWFSSWNPDAGTVQATDKDGKPILWKADQALNLIYDISEKDKTKLKEVQKMLREGGFYGQEIGIPGVLDEATKNAWASFLTDSARNNLAPKDNLLKRINERWDLRRKGVTYSSIDPAAIDASIQTAAQNILGRTLTSAESADLVRVMKKWEAEAMTTGLLASDTPKVDFDSRINEFIQDQNKEELRLMAWDKGMKSFETIFGS